MALRIGVLLLASCNFLNAGLIDIGQNRLIGIPKPAVSFTKDSHQDHQDQDGTSLGDNLPALGYEEDHTQASQGKDDHKPKPVQAVIGPKPSVIVANYVIGDSPIPEKIKVKDDDHINPNKTPVYFGALDNVDEDDHEKAKAPITVVTVPEVSTVSTTQHQVAPNQAINRSNIPSVKDHKNYYADELFFKYIDKLSTQIQEVVEDDKPTETPVPQPVQSRLVEPGNLQKFAKAQLAVAQANEHAPIVIQKFLTTDEEQKIFPHQVKQGYRRK